MRRAIGRISPATVLAAAALFVSLGGVSYGVATGSINSRAIENGTIQSRDVRDGSLKGSDVANGTLLGRDVKDGALTGPDLAENSLGDREIDEPQLDINRLGGVAVTRFVKNVERVETRTANDGATIKIAPRASCPRGKRLIGGGAWVESSAFVPVALTANGPQGTAWVAAAYATAATGNWTLVNVAICG
jgi:hypothetical protein